MERIINQDYAINSLQISKLYDVPAGNFKPGLNVLIKNITDENITLEVKMPGNKDYISTVFYPGWNVELINEIKNVTEKQLQYGY